MKYVEPEITVEKLLVEDIITTSTIKGDGNTGGMGGED